MLRALACCALLGAGSAPSAPPADPPNTCRLVLPERIPVAVGREANLYFDNVVLVPNWRAYLFDVTCAKGKQQDERWTFTPQPGDVGDHPLRLTVRDAEYRVVAAAETTLRVVPADAGADRDVRLLCIGDSLTNASVYTEELLALCRPPGNPRLTLLGTRQPRPDSPEHRHEGYGGWTFRRFVTHYVAQPDPKDYKQQSSPFVFAVEGRPLFDFPRYVRERCGGKAPDVVTIALGCNDVFGADEEGQEAAVEEALFYADQLVAGVREADPRTHIGLVVLVPPAASQDAFGANYGCGQTRWQYRRNQHRFVERLMVKYRGREGEGITLIPAYVNLDTARNYPSVTTPANARSGVEVARQSNAAHPAPEGYRQMADSIYGWLKALPAR